MNLFTHKPTTLMTLQAEPGKFTLCIFFKRAADPQRFRIHPSIFSTALLQGLLGGLLPLSQTDGVLAGRIASASFFE